MRIALSIVLILLSPSTFAVAAAPKTGSKPKQYTIEQLMKSAKVSGLFFSSDESKVLYSSNVRGAFNAWTISSRGGTARPVTRSTTESTYAVSYFPNDDRILYSHDQGGNENTHLYVLEIDGKERDLTPGDKLKVTDEIVAAVKRNGVPVEYVLFPDEGHGFRKIRNEIEGDGKVLQFLDKYLKGRTGHPIPKNG